MVGDDGSVWEKYIDLVLFYSFFIFDNNFVIFVYIFVFFGKNGLVDSEVVVVDWN